MEGQNRSLPKDIKTMSRGLNLSLLKNLQKRGMIKRIEMNNQRNRIRRLRTKLKIIIPIVLQMI